MQIDLSLQNTALYDGCEIELVAGKLNLKTPVADAVNIVGTNINRLVQTLAPSDRDTCVLTGPMSIWAYLVVFHAVVHAFREVRYDDGRNGAIVVARHG